MFVIRSRGGATVDKYFPRKGDVVGGARGLIKSKHVEIKKFLLVSPGYRLHFHIMRNCCFERYDAVCGVEDDGGIAIPPP